MPGESPMNGHAIPDLDLKEAHDREAPPTAPTQTVTPSEAQLDAIMEPIIGNTVNGLMVSFQTLPADVVARSIARVMGRVLGRLICQGFLASVLQVRAAMKNGFASSMDAIPTAPPPAGMAQNGQQNKTAG